MTPPARLVVCARITATLLAVTASSALAGEVQQAEAPSPQTWPSATVTPPPCLPVSPKPVHRRHPRHKKRPSPPQVTGAPAPVSAPPQPEFVDARVMPVAGAVTSILGRKVEDPKGEDLGRVVDVLADAEGRVRVAIIDFGGFLGVGSRRIAVDWPLLRVRPGSSDDPLVLSVTRDKLLSAPEYKGTPHPEALMLPAESK